MTTMVIPFPDPDFWNTLLSGFLIWAAIFILAVFLWNYNKKQQWLTNYRSIEEEFDNSLRSALVRMIVYVFFSFPIMFLLWLGASSFLVAKPSWNFALSLTIITVNLVLMVWLVAYPLYLLLKATTFLWAAEINLYMKEAYPLEYYEPKVAFLKKMKK